MKKILSMMLCALLVIAFAASAAAELPNFLDLKVGEDYTDIKADIVVLNHRTDLADTKYPEYIEAFQALYPNVTVRIDTITNYADDALTRLTGGNWGSIMMIPALDKDELPNYFIPLGTVEELSTQYNFIDSWMWDGIAYGVPSTGNAQGVVYNKKVFEQAGITELPKTPDEFIAALQAIKDNTDAIPLYTNYEAGWTAGAWDAYIFGSATGDPEFHNNIPHTANPFSDRGDGTGPYAVYYTLYESVARGLVEDDPMSTDWEASKGMINRGEIATMVLGSWAVQQFKDAGDQGDDIAYMPFPITVDGQRYAGASSNYAYAINKNAATDNQIASMLYVKWLLDESPIFTDEGCIPARKDGEMPGFLADFEGVTLITNAAAPAGEESLFDDVNLESEVGINSDNYPKLQIIESALTGSATLDDLMNDWNAKWSDAQESLGVDVTM